MRIKEQLREDNMLANIKQASQRDNNNAERFISDQYKDPDMEAKIIQTKKEKKAKEKKNSKVDISENNSSDTWLNDVEFADEGIDGIIDQSYSIKLISIESI